MDRNPDIELFFSKWQSRKQLIVKKGSAAGIKIQELMHRVNIETGNVGHIGCGPTCPQRRETMLTTTCKDCGKQFKYRRWENAPLHGPTCPKFIYIRCSHCEGINYWDDKPCDCD